jgi:hypothetical protein
MPFKGFDKVELETKFPVVVGKKGKPSVSIAENGRVTFSAEVSKVFAGCTFVRPAQDGLRLRLDGFAKVEDMGKGGEKAFTVNLVHPSSKDGKPAKSKSVGMPGTMLLKAINYDYKAAGNQVYDVEKFDAEKHVVIFALPEKTPAKRPVTKREPKAPKMTNKAATAPNGGIAAVPPAKQGGDDDLVIDT